MINDGPFPYGLHILHNKVLVEISGLKTAMINDQISIMFLKSGSLVAETS